MNGMFCFQCEQTANGSGCTKAGVCGKTAEVANAQDELLLSLISFARAAEGKSPSEEGAALMMKGLFTNVTNVNFDRESIERITAEVDDLTEKLGGMHNLTREFLRSGNEDVDSLRWTLIIGIRGMAAYAWHAYILGKEEPEVTDWLFQGMKAVGEDHSIEAWLGLLMEFGEVNLRCMALLDQANTKAYGHPVPTKVTMKVEKGPFIVVTGHDLYDLKQLLEQTVGKGVDIYTHGEMLPAHAYPGLKKYPHLKGNFGTAWQNQRKEFKDVPAAFFYTTNCLMPPHDSYKGNLFTTAVVDYPGIRHIKEDNKHRKDFTPVIERAIELGGYDEDKVFTGINGGSELLTGFARNTVLGVADQVIEAVKAGQISHFFLVGGCDGAKPGRSYYTEFVKQTPKDSVVLTLACGKYRFNDLDLGEIGGLPRLMDMGQCNDAYSAIQVALALSQAFACGVNELPLTLVLSWYEKKAVCILLTLLALGIENIYIGPSLPAFLSKNVLDILVEKFNLIPISTPEEDLKKILD